ncbi:hypothetical protein [Gemmata obscuriglobus]|uniref:hypothetical protein n=1 Tax=Gemmata obscuriglobus TaxID=114 RepID=UPI0002DA57E8|nr:hypothetical protein [Gemmata obscuriglobus]
MNPTRPVPPNECGVLCGGGGAGVAGRRLLAARAFGRQPAEQFRASTPPAPK